MSEFRLRYVTFMYELDDQPYTFHCVATEYDESREIGIAKKYLELEVGLWDIDDSEIHIIESDFVDEADGFKIKLERK